MRVLVIATPPGARLAPAAAALALRGHEVLWSGPAPATGLPAEVTKLESAGARRRARADVVMGEGRDVSRVAIAGRRAGAHAMVLALAPETVARWSWLGRLAWHSLYSIGLIEPAVADRMRQGGHGLDPDRLALWSDEAPAAAPDATHGDVEVLERAGERALARHRGRAARPAVFLDRDGTLVVERGYLSDANDLELLPGVPLALQNLRAAGFALVVISNQSGVGRGLFPLSRVYEAMARLRRLLRAHGAELDAVYFCPHRPEEGCDCRKPQPGLLRRAAEDLQLDVGRSFMIGDKRIDAETGQRAGAEGVLVRSGYGRDEERGLEAVEPRLRPVAVFDDFATAAAWMRSRLESSPHA